MICESGCSVLPPLCYLVSVCLSGPCSEKYQDLWDRTLARRQQTAEAGEGEETEHGQVALGGTLT